MESKLIKEELKNNLVNFIRYLAKNIRDNEKDLSLKDKEELSLELNIAIKDLEFIIKYCLKD